jgi:hypothetical protein
MVNRTILRLAFPGGGPRPKPGPYDGDDGTAVDASSTGDAAASNGRPAEREAAASAS